MYALLSRYYNAVFIQRKTHLGAPFWLMPFKRDKMITDQLLLWSWNNMCERGDLSLLQQSTVHTQVALKNEPQRQNILCTLGHIQLCIPKMKRLFELGLGLCIGKVCSKWKGLRGFKMAYWLKNVSRDAIPCNDIKGIYCMQPFYLYFSFHGVYSMHEHVYSLARCAYMCIQAYMYTIWWQPLHHTDDSRLFQIN